MRTLRPLFRQSNDTGQFATPVLPFEFDDAGNMTEAVQGGSAAKQVYTHDAWGRLVEVKLRSTAEPNPPEFVQMTCRYNGLHW